MGICTASYKTELEELYIMYSITNGIPFDFLIQMLRGVYVW